MATDVGYQGAFEVRFLGPIDQDVDTDEMDRPQVHAVAHDTILEPLCGQSRYRLLPTGQLWAAPPRHLECCAACLSVAPTQAIASRLPRAGLDIQPTWTYGFGLNRLSIDRDGVTFRLVGHHFFRRRHLRWEEAEAFAPKKYTMQGIRGEGAGRKWGSPTQWYIVLQRRSGRPIPILFQLGPLERFSEEKAYALAMAMNTALALPRGTK
jgi:hypothetical protein